MMVGMSGTEIRAMRASDWPSVRAIYVGRNSEWKRHFRD